MIQPRRKLIEVALPLEAINRESAREKSIRHGHPSTLHLWWSRKPLATARAVLFAQLVDDPSARPEEFPTQGEQDVERKRLFDLIERLVIWENTTDEKLLAEAHAEILKSTNGNPPSIVDPFAGGGSIPLEAQRLGLCAEASDLNPIPVLLNKALIEIPSKFADQAPVFPGAMEAAVSHWPRATGLAEDVRLYGSWIHDQACKRIGHMYPTATLSNGAEANVIAWIWARTVRCTNPACGREMPLVSSWHLAKSKGREAAIIAAYVGKELTFRVVTGTEAKAVSGVGTVGRTGAVCIGCRAPAPLKYIRLEGRAGRIGVRMMALVVEGQRGRQYVGASDHDQECANVDRPEDVPSGQLAATPRDIKAPTYGMTETSHLFTNRQLTALMTLIDLLGEVRDIIIRDAQERAWPADDRRLSEGGRGAVAYADAVITYLALVQSKMTNLNSSLTSWMNDRGAFRETFARQAIPMVWSFAEANPLSEVGGGWLTMLDKEARTIDRLPMGSGVAIQADAARRSYPGALISTDPPYYDNIEYADLADYYYVWLRRSLFDIFPDLLGTLLSPKADELVANPYRHGSAAAAKEFFESGFRSVFTKMRKEPLADFPITVYYAFKQTESTTEGLVSTGWETFLDALTSSGWSVTATWPVRTEGVGRAMNQGLNALASSIVIACRPRNTDAPVTNRRGLIAALKESLPDALRELQQGSVAPVDLAQAAIGPGMAVFTRYARVIEVDGADMTVRTALALINQVLDETLTEQEGDFDADTRFCVKWFSQYAWDETDSGTADVLARATNTSIDGLRRGGVFSAVAGRARLLGPDDLSESWDPLTDVRTSVWEVALHLAKAVSERGSVAAAELMNAAGQRVDLDIVKELAYLLYNISERKGWTSAALLFNGLGTSWIDLDAAARASAGKSKPIADTLTFDEAEN